MKPVAIIGVGPAGLLAAWGCYMRNQPYRLFGIGAGDRAFKSEMGGSQFLHKSVPGLCDENAPDAMIKLKVIGSWRQYRLKVYGQDNVPFASIARAQDKQEMPAWSLENIYEFLWEAIADDGMNVVVGNVGPEQILNMVESNQFEAIVSTIPKPAVCLEAHAFNSQPVRITQSTIIPESVDNMIIYDATWNTPWYRTSKVFGAVSTEYGFNCQDVVMEEPHLTRSKPMGSNCNCWEGTVNFAGRYGAWDKALLSHDAFELTYDMFKDN